MSEEVARTEATTSLPSLTTAAAVSSHEVSIPKIKDITESILLILGAYFPKDFWAVERASEAGSPDKTVLTAVLRRSTSLSFPDLEERTPLFAVSAVLT